jgi:hypothetical protein
VIFIVGLSSLSAGAGAGAAGAGCAAGAGGDAGSGGATGVGGCALCALAVRGITSMATNKQRMNAPGLGYDDAHARIRRSVEEGVYTSMTVCPTWRYIAGTL